MSYILVRYLDNNRLEIRKRKRERVARIYYYSTEYGDLPAVVLNSANVRSLKVKKTQMENEERVSVKQDMRPVKEAEKRQEKSPEKEQEKIAVKTHEESLQKKQEESTVNEGEESPEKKQERTKVKKHKKRRDKKEEKRYDKKQTESSVKEPEIIKANQLEGNLSDHESSVICLDLSEQEERPEKKQEKIRIKKHKNKREKKHKKGRENEHGESSMKEPETRTGVQIEENLSDEESSIIWLDLSEQEQSPKKKQEGTKVKKHKKRRDKKEEKKTDKKRLESSLKKSEKKTANNKEENFSDEQGQITVKKQEESTVNERVERPENEQKRIRVKKHKKKIEKNYIEWFMKKLKKKMGKKQEENLSDEESSIICLDLSEKAENPEKKREKIKVKKHKRERERKHKKRREKKEEKRTDEKQEGSSEVEEAKKEKERPLKKQKRSTVNEREESPEKEEERIRTKTQKESRENNEEERTAKKHGESSMKKVEKRRAKKQEENSPNQESTVNWLGLSEEEESTIKIQERRPMTKQKEITVRKQVESSMKKPEKRTANQLEEDSSDQESPINWLDLFEQEESTVKIQERRPMKKQKRSTVNEREESRENSTVKKHEESSMKKQKKNSANNVEESPMKKPEKRTAKNREESPVSEQENRTLRSLRKRTYYVNEDDVCEEDSESVTSRQRDSYIEPKRPRKNLIKHYCLFCDASVERIVKHLMEKHAEEPQVKEILETSNPGHKKLKKNILVAKGDLVFNRKVLAGEGGKLITSRHRRADRSCKLVTCDNCWSIMKPTSFYDHRKICFKLGTSTEKAPNLYENINDDGFIEEVVKNMRFGFPDVLLQNKLYYSFGKNLWMEKGYKSTKDVQQKLRYLKSLEEELQGAGSNKDLNDFLQPKCVDDIVAAIKKMSGFQRMDRKLVIKHPTKILKLSDMVIAVANFAKMNALKRNDETRAKEVTNFMVVFHAQTAKALKRVARTYMKNKEGKRMEDLPTFDDVWILTRHLEEEAASLLKKLKKHPCQLTWIALRDNLVTWTGLFNRRRGGASQKLKLADYYRARRVAEKDLQLLKNPTKEEIEFLKSLLVADISHKEHLVKVFIPKMLQEAIKTLVAYRRAAEINDKNEYVFAAVGDSLNPVDAGNILRKYRNLLPPEARDKMSFNNLRKQGTSILRLLDLDDGDLETWALHLGHTRGVQEKYYTLKGNPECLLKTGKILSLLRNGNIQENSGKKLEDIPMDLDTELPSP